MPQLRRETILAANKRRVKKLIVPEWNGGGDGFVYVRTLMADEEQRLADCKADELGMVIETCLVGVCDKDGERVFKDDDAEALRSTPAEPLARCAEAIVKLNNLHEAGAAQTKKGSRRQPDDSPSS